MRIMNHDELVKYVEGLKKERLTPVTFDAFISNAKSIFEPQGTNLIFHERVGKNKSSKSMFENGKRPNWDEFGGHSGYSALTTKDFVIRGEKSEKHDGRFLVVHFNEDYGFEVFGMNHKPPFIFSYDPNKSLYVAEEARNGNQEFPYEHLYLRS